MYPEVKFTCDGNITKWIGGGGDQLQIWDKTDDGVTYNLTTSYQYTQCVLRDPIPFKKGSILGLSRPWVIVNGGSRSYRTEGNTVNISAVYNGRDYPLMGVVTSTYERLVANVFITCRTYLQVPLAVQLVSSQRTC